jgi:NADPH:quinone reductase-like Zn-dependent oxidoreductase
MNGVLIRATGGRDVLRVQEVARPDPAPGEVLVKVRAAGVNPVDWKYRRGLVERDLPAVLGEDISGIVEASRAERFVPGDEVFGIASSGGYAEFALASGSALAVKPDRLSYAQAAALPVSAMTAWQGSSTAAS